MNHGEFVYEVVEYVHTFLIGTVLYITAVGLYQLFVKEIDFPAWLKVESTEELETNLIGVTVVVLAVNFMGAFFAGGTDDLLQYGAGIALPIAALGLFVGLRAWAANLPKKGAGREARHEAAEPGMAQRLRSRPIRRRRGLKDPDDSGAVSSPSVPIPSMQTSALERIGCTTSPSESVGGASRRTCVSSWRRNPVLCEKSLARYVASLTVVPATVGTSADTRRT